LIGAEDRDPTLGSLRKEIDLVGKQASNIPSKE
jgi:hypothetical protein